MQIKKYLVLLAFISCCILACKNSGQQPKTEEGPSEQFKSFVRNFDTLTLPLIISYPGFLKDGVFIDHNLKKIPDDDMHKILKMDSVPPWPLYFYGQLPMVDSTYYLVTYFEMKIKHNPSMWWTLIKFDANGKLLSESNISYCVKDSNEIRERFCKIAPNYQCFYVEVKGRWDEPTHSIKDTVVENRTINLTLDQNR